MKREFKWKRIKKKREGDGVRFWGTVSLFTFKIMKYECELANFNLCELNFEL